MTSFKEVTRGPVWHYSGSNVPRRARPGLAGPGPHTGTLLLDAKGLMTAMLGIQPRVDRIHPRVG